jgi:hypothetical protein
LSFIIPIEELARIFECEALKEVRFAVAQYIADRYGRENLYAEIRKLFTRTFLAPRDTHELFAAWREFKNHTGKRLPFPMVITTNYDDVLERRLADAGLPYHLLSYQADGPHHGLFYHRSPDNGLRIIERPCNVLKFSDAFLLANPLLFLGHGLVAPDIESLVRFAHRDHPGPRSWAVVLKNDGIEYWRQCGVEILSKPVNIYVNELR